MPFVQNPAAYRLLAGCTLLAANCVHAQPVPLPVAEILPELSVTAKGYAGEELQTPLATSVVDRNEIAARGANNVGEALRGLPGLAIALDGPQGQNPVVRGLRKESVALLVDGMRLNSAQPAGAIASLMSLGLAERMEVVKGPASVLYGTGALGGAINVLMPQATFTPGLRFRALGNVDSASESLRATGVANFSHGDHALMAGVSLADIDEYRSRRGEVPRTGYDSGSIIGQYRFRIDGSQQVRASLQRHADKDVWYPGSAKPGTPAMLGTVTVRAPEQTRTLAEVGYGRKGSGNAPVNLDVRAYRQDVHRQIQAYASAVDRNQSETDVTFATEGVDAKATWLAHPAHLLSFGVNAWQMEASPERYLTNNAPLFNNRIRNDPFRDGRIDAFGVYLQDDMHFGKLNLLAGLRHDRVKGTAAAINNGAVNTGLTRRDNAASGSIGAIYEAAPLLRPYANLSRAFRAGEMRERFESSPRGDGYYYLGNPQIRPEYATQIEVGMKGASRDLTYSAAAYRTRITDYITGRVTGAVQAGLPIKQTENVGRVVLRGLELQARWKFMQGQWATAAYSRVRGENKVLNEPLFQVPADELSLGWEGHIASGWTGDTTLRFVDRQDRIATVFSGGTENATAGFVTVDIGATYRWRKQSLRIVLKNLADKAYHEHLTEGVSGQEILAPGRSMMVSWQGDF